MSGDKNSTELPSAEELRRLMLQRAAKPQKLTAPISKDEVNQALAARKESTTLAGSAPVENVQIQNNPSQDEYVILKLTQIDPPTISQRQAYPREMVDQMATAIRRQAHGKSSILDGQIHPVVVVPHPTNLGRYVMVDGFTRYQAFRDHFLADEIKATIRHGLSDAEVFAMAYAANVDRNGTSDFDRGMALTEAFKQNWYKDRADAASALGIDKVTVSGLLAFADFPDPLLEVIRAEPSRFSHNFSYKLQTLLNKNAAIEEVVEVANKIKDSKISWKKFSQFVSEYQGHTDRPKKARKESRSILDYGKVRATDSAVSLDLESLPAGVAPLLVEKLERFVTDFLKSNIPSQSINTKTDDTPE